MLHRQILEYCVKLDGDVAQNPGQSQKIEIDNILEPAEL